MWVTKALCYCSKKSGWYSMLRFARFDRSVQKQNAKAGTVSSSYNYWPLPSQDEATSHGCSRKQKVTKAPFVVALKARQDVWPDGWPNVMTAQQWTASGVQFHVKLNGVHQHARQLPKDEFGQSLIICATPCNRACIASSVDLDSNGQGQRADAVY